MRQVANRYTLLISTMLSTCLIAVPSTAQFARSRSTHPRPTAETWFEGWYTRITPSDGSNTIGLIVGSFRRLGTEGEQHPSGYIALIKQDQGGRLEVHEAFPQHVQVQSAGWRKGYLLGVRTSEVQWDFKPQIPGTTFTTRIDARAGRIALCARAPFRLVEIEICAEPATFAPLAIPTSDGFLPGTLQSFSATATIRAYRVGLLGKHTLVAALDLDNSALEFGGTYFSEILASE